MTMTSGKDELNSYEEYCSSVRIMCERYMKLLNWRRRIAHDIKPHYCGACVFGCRCERLLANERIFAAIMRGEVCPDLRSYWEKILGDSP